MLSRVSNTISLAQKKHYVSIIWALCGYFCYTITMSLAKLLGDELSIPTIIFIRSLFAQIVFIPFILDHKFGYYKTKKLNLHILRIIFMAFSMFCTYYTYTTLPISLATSIGFSGPIFIVILSAIFLKEYVSPTQWLATIIGYLGVLIVIQPINFVLSLGIVMAILANIFAGLSLITMKILTKTEKEKTLLLYSNTAILCIMGIGAAFTWTTPSLANVFLLIIIGISAITYQYCLIKAFKIGKASMLAPFEYSRLLFAIPIGLFFFHEIISIWIFIGSAVLIITNCYLAYSKELDAI